MPPIFIFAFLTVAIVWVALKVVDTWVSVPHPGRGAQLVITIVGLAFLVVLFVAALGHPVLRL
jgi:hypothetical protein